MQMLIQEPDVDEEITQVYKLFDRDGKGVSASGLAEIMTSLLQLRQEHAQEDKTPGDNQEAFSDHPNSKKTVVTSISIPDASDIIEDSDLDGDGRLSFDEFAKILMEKSDKLRPKKFMNWIVRCFNKVA